MKYPIEKMRRCIDLLPPPGGEVVAECLDEIESLRKQLAEANRKIEYEQLCASELEQQLASETMRLEIALRIKTEEHTCCSEDLIKLRESEQTGWKEAAIAWEVCGSIHEAFAKKKDALYSTRHSDFERHAEDARRKIYANGGN